MARQSRNPEPPGFEKSLWEAADKLRGSMNAREYKHISLGPAFPNNINATLTERQGGGPRPVNPAARDRESVFSE